MNLSVRLALLGLAWVMVGLATAGIFLPLLPTTPFLLLAAWLFSRSSPRLEQWLAGHALFGTHCETGGMTALLRGATKSARSY